MRGAADLASQSHRAEQKGRGSARLRRTLRKKLSVVWDYVVMNAVVGMYY